jgi:hypothetical protein
MDILPHNKRCKYCRNKVENLCDVIKGEWIGHPPKFAHNKAVTCDNYICKDCTTKLYNMDICKDCLQEFKRIIDKK